MKKFTKIEVIRKKISNLRIIGESAPVIEDVKHSVIIGNTVHSVTTKQGNHYDLSDYKQNLNGTIQQKGFYGAKIKLIFD